MRKVAAGKEAIGKEALRAGQSARAAHTTHFTLHTAAHTLAPCSPCPPCEISFFPYPSAKLSREQGSLSLTFLLRSSVGVSSQHPSALRKLDDRFEVDIRKRFGDEVFEPGFLTTQLRFRRTLPRETHE